MGFFEVYWKYLGFPLSVAKGRMVDAFPFSLVDTAVCLGIAVSLLAVASWLPGFRPLKPWRGKLLGGPIFLSVLGVGQGAFPWSLAPTALRSPLERVIHPPPLPEHIQDSLWRAQLQNLWQETTWEGYASLSEGEALVTCNRLLDSVLNRLDLTPGRRVERIKDMGPLTTFLGLVYGGPAFHDPFFGELAIIRDKDMPSSRYWRLHATCHETAHAKGYTREMDAEILTALALLWSDDARYRNLGAVLFLAKAGKAFPLPEPMRQDMIAARMRRQEAESHQPILRFFRNFAEKVGFRNEPAKYGDRKRGEPWNPRQPFFATVAQALKTYPGFIKTYGF